MKDKDAVTREYSNGEVTVVWRAGRCVHSGICVAGLGQVFNPKRQPWIDVAMATTAQLVAQVAECPSRALSLADSGASAT